MNILKATLKDNFVYRYFPLKDNEVQTCRAEFLNYEQIDVFELLKRINYEPEEAYIITQMQELKEKPEKYSIIQYTKSIKLKKLTYIKKLYCRNLARKIRKNK